MLQLASWISPKDESHFQRAFAPFPEVNLQNAAKISVPLAGMDGLLLAGGPDIAAEFLHQEIPDPSPIHRNVNPARDRWEFEATQAALARGLPIFAVCKGLQLLNVSLGGTLRLDIPGHDDLIMREAALQELRTERGAAHRFEKVNSSHHQAIDSLGDGLVVEAWSAKDDIIEQVRLTNYPFALAVQYHPERGDIDLYAPLFADFVSQVAQASSLRK
ncbi:MAG: gamma-glutamyl-gamma-aminobutyrate hydrolase family protein [Verrucomicrobiota bacterium]|nr:gamma-glutamyl-gamma-aminobutyrate hydrolase family protein [Verrucomicrobiota bacterium]